MCEKECVSGTYGHNCVNNCSSHCLNDSTCNKQTGHCDRGCNPGYTINDCSQICLPGHYGTNCRERCSGHCINNEPCDHVGGVCPDGCEDGYTGKLCNNSCADGFYGTNCSLRCPPNCIVCRHTDGYCSSCKEKYYGRNCSLICFPNCKSGTCQQTDRLCTCNAGWMGDNCTEECVQSYGENCKRSCSKDCVNQTCDRMTGICLNGCMDGTNCDQVSGKTYTNDVPLTVGGTVGTMVVIIIGAVIAAFVLRLKRKAAKVNKREFIVLEPKSSLLREHEPPKTADDALQHDHTNDTMEYALISREKTKKGPPVNKHISVRNIKAQIANMSSNECAGFKSEYHNIPRGELHPSLEAKKPENKIKNRYTTIYPYDHSRVILKTSPSVEGDYINASYIEDARGKQIYIATQGPKPKTISDLWTMIWQEGVCNIVCLTNLKEGTKNKCAQYWPDINDKLQGGTLTTRTDRLVTMFHYTTWSDHGVADPLSLVVFHRHVIRSTANAAGNYTVVHCR
ncbi:receptor-type tyrosine-protein phosphatase epsilon [Magallana gigas]|uniref:receptor-type tyrosine-protein phosphatase epsilon n=1 Tax=Magallana gigas TaxID=29159 RepID=UPI00333E2412